MLAPFVDATTLSRRNGLPVLTLITLLAMLRALTPQLFFTGDEPHYASQAISLFSHFFPILDVHTLWHRFLTASGIFPSPIPDTEIGAPLEYRQSLITSLVFAVPLVLFNLQAARWFDFALAVIAILILFQIVSSTSFARQNNVSARVLNVLTIAGTTLSLPFLAYSDLVYPEILLLLAVCVTLRFLQLGAVNSTIVSAVVLAFIYVRALPLSLALFIVLCWTQYSSGVSKAYLNRAVLKYSVGILVLLVFQVILYGSITGGGAAPFAPSLASLPIRIGVQLFEMRHGLLAYSPIFFIAFAGLISGSLRRQAACQQAGFLCLAYVLSFCWASASESWTARYWIVALPFLAIGFRYWISSVDSWVSVVPAMPLLLVTLCNSILFVLQPNLFLANRAGSVTYTDIFNLTRINLSLYLPVDFPYPYFTNTVPYLLIYAVIVIVSLVFLSIARNGKARYAITALALILVPFAMCCLNTIPANAYTAKPLPSGAGIDILLQNDATRVSAIQFDQTFNYAWTGMPGAVTITCFSQNGALIVAQEPMRSLIALENCYKDIQITSKNLPGASLFQNRIKNVSLFSGLF
jgi:hypothetical protein